MSECHICKKTEVLPFKCKFCKQYFCSEHRLPENHECAGLQHYKESQRKKNSESDLPKKIIYKPEKVKKEIEIVSKPIVIPSSFKRSFENINLTEKLIGVCILMYALQTANFTGILPLDVTELFHLMPSNVMVKPWTLITHIFLHGSIAHLFFNMWVLYLFGSRLESHIGSRLFLSLFLISGFIGGLGFVVFSYGNIPAVGASGAIYGIFGCLAMLEPNLIVYVQLIFPMRLIHAAGLFALIDILSFNANDRIGHSAHLAGMAVGLYLGYKLRKEISIRRNNYLEF